MFGILTDSPPGDTGDLATFFGSANDTISNWMSYLMVFIGLIGIVWAGVLLIKKLMAPLGYGHGSWASIMLMLLIGGAMTAGGTSMSGLFVPSSEKGEGGKTSPDPSPSTTPETSAPTPGPTHQPTSSPAEPADLTWLWITLGITAAVAILVVGVLLVVMLTKKLRRAAHAEAEQKRLQEAKRRRLEEAWTRWTDRHQAIKEKVLTAETDWDMIFSYPCLSDATVPQTRDLHRAMRSVDHADNDMPTGLDETTDIASLPYPKKVLAAEEAWEAAFSFAKRTGQKLLPREERKTIEQIVKLLHLARDSGGSPSERDVAYARAQKLIAGLRVFKMPEKALAVLTHEQRLMLEAPAPGQTPKVAAMAAEEKKSAITL